MLKFAVRTKRSSAGVKVKDPEVDTISTSSSSSDASKNDVTKCKNDIKDETRISGPGSTSSVSSADSDLGSMSTDPGGNSQGHNDLDNDLDSPHDDQDSLLHHGSENSLELTITSVKISQHHESILRSSSSSKCKKNVSFQDTVYMIESAHDSSSGIASDDQAPASSPPSTSSYKDGVLSSKASSGYAETTTGFRYYDIDDDDADDDADDDEDFGYPRPRNLHTFYTSAQVHMTQWPGMNSHKQLHANGYVEHSHEVQSKNYLSNYKSAFTDLKSKARCYFDIIPDSVITKIFSCLNSDQLCRNALVCRRFYDIVWQPHLWTSIRITNPKIDVDAALRVLTKRLSCETPHVCLMVDKIYLNGCLKLTDRGLYSIAKRCIELRHLEVANCPEITNIALFELVSRCVNLELLNVSGCPSVTCVCLTPEATVQAAAYGNRLLSLRHLDMTDCVYLDDSSLQILASYCSQLVYLYLRRCYKVSDIGVQYVANYCTALKEFSLCDCRNITDFGMREIAKLGKQLRYLSVAKCDKISDVGVKYVAQYCRKMRYLNVRGCPAVSDDSLDVLAQCCRRLKSLDIGKCDITDEGLQSLAENSPQLRRLSVKSCDAITDQGILSLAYNCPNLQQLNIQDCHLSVEAYRAVKRNCKRCIIEHTNPGFY